MKAIWMLAVGFGLVFGTGAPVTCDIYRYKDENGVWHFSNIKSNSRYEPFVTRSKKKRPKRISRPDANQYDPFIVRASKLFNVDRFFIKAIIRAESDFDCRAISSKGAQGLMQLMPETADEMAVEDPFDPKDNIYGGTRYMSLLLKRFKNNKTLALAAYNAGPEVVESNNGVPPYPETRTFVKRVMDYYQSYNGKAK